MEEENKKASKTPDISDESFTSRMLYTMIRAKYPKVCQLSTETLQIWIDNSEIISQVLLLDVRETEEHTVSSINNAIHIMPSEENLFPMLDKIEGSSFKKVVAFCSVGYRSSMFAQKLYSEMKKHKNIEDVEIYNLEGSIFKWANENRDLVDSTGNSTTFVHPYNVVWGKFLAAEKRRYLSCL